MNGRARLLGGDLPLVHGVRALKVGGDQQRRVSVLLELLGGLPGERSEGRPRALDDRSRARASALQSARVR
jgi:hypothetical protein